ncbi:unnamed protein product [Arctia plantaginis]|uniref:Peptidase S1 domain-containing protein n=1 Tax=Arctia plantaginis TaxID=874455 RepID=A0A8S1AEL3_ARCPL|nr:unnamed protein product [Arctia plantaginis]CAB3253879.1 unnamed protein product [Arctia plantaginis]
MYRALSLLCLALFIQNSFGAFEDRPTYGYHLRYGVPKAWKLKTAESVRIIGGSPVKTADLIPHQAGIITTLTTGWTSICGGSLISTTRVLTAAHCWFDGQSQARLFTVILGSLTIFSGGTRIETTNVRVHPEWRTNMLHDIAVVVIRQVTLTNNIKLISLPTASEANLNFVGVTGTISGFGKTSNAQASFPPTTALHHTTVTVITNEICQRNFPIKIESSHICTGGDNGRGSCDGDSGGPLTVTQNGRNILVGVVSFGHSDGCEARRPSVFTRVASYISWIHFGAFEDRPTYGYHLRYGVSKAWQMKMAEGLRVIGGSPVNTAAAIPHQAGIITTLITGWTSICGGSLISTTRILTAAHCWWDGQSQARLFTVVLGSLTIFSGGTRIETSNVRVHPEWRTNMLHDIAVVIIRQVTISNNIQTIPLPTINEVNLSFVGATGTISGFGKTSDAQSGFPPTTALHHTTVTVIANEICQRNFPILIHGSHICTGGENGRGSCDGDSGGPLTVIHNHRSILVGVVSFGHSDGCEARRPSVFTRVSAYIGWIQSLL